MDPEALKTLLPVLLFMAGLFWAVTWWLVQRMIDGYAARLTKTEATMADLARDLASRPTHADMDGEITTLQGMMAALRADQQRHEERMLEALRDHNTVVRDDVRQLRDEVRAVHGRIDGLVAVRNGGA